MPCAGYVDADLELTGRLQQRARCYLQINVSALRLDAVRRWRLAQSPVLSMDELVERATETSAFSRPFLPERSCAGCGAPSERHECEWCGRTRDA